MNWFKESPDGDFIHTGDRYHTLLSRRFDRTDAGRRIHFASAMTLLGLSDGDDAGTGHGYLDIVDFILQGWQPLATRLGISKREMDIFAEVFERTVRDKW